MRQITEKDARYHKAVGDEIRQRLRVDLFYGSPLEMRVAECAGEILFGDWLAKEYGRDGIAGLHDDIADAFRAVADRMPEIVALAVNCPNELAWKKGESDA